MNVILSRPSKYAHRSENVTHDMGPLTGSRSPAMYKVKLFLLKLAKVSGLRNLGNEWMPDNVLPELILKILIIISHATLLSC